MSEPSATQLGRLMVVVAVAVGIVALLALDARATYGARTTADEPQYLLSAISLGEDLDLDISDEIAAGRFRPFHEMDLDPQTVVRGGAEISPHDPLLPTLLAVPMWVGGWALAKASLAAMAGLLAALTLWVAVRRFDARPGVGALVVLAFGLTPPLTSYGTQVYPEVPAALAVTVAIAALTGNLGRRALVLCGVALVALPWLAVKYGPVVVVLGLCLAVRLGRQGRWVTLGCFAVVMGGAALVYLVLHHVLYDGWTVYASGDHFTQTGELSVVGTDPQWLGRSRRVLGLLVDRGFGLAAWSPMYLVAVAAVGAWLMARPRHWWVVVLPLVAGWLNATFVALTMHGWWWPGRQVVVVLPALVVMTAWWASRVRVVLPAVVILAAVGLFGWLWLVAESSFDLRTLVVDFEASANPLYRAWRLLLPDGRTPDGATEPLTVLWWVVVLALGVLGALSVRRGVAPHEAPAVDGAAAVPGADAYATVS
jgi:hypothetical protein